MDGHGMHFFRMLDIFKQVNFFFKLLFFILIQNRLTPFN